MNNPKVLFIISLLVGLYAFFPATYHPWKKMIQAQRWQQTTCTIKDIDRNGTVNYTFLLNNTLYNYNKIDLAPEGYARKVDLNTLYQKYPPQSTHNCYVNIHNPPEAVLERTMGWYYLVSAIPFLFMIVGIKGLYQLKPTPSKSIPVGGFYELSTSASPFLQFIYAIIFAVALNGALAAIYYQFWLPEYQQNKIPIMASFFMLCFGFAAFMSLLGIIYQFLNIWNPRTRIFINSREYKRGQRYQMRYLIKGRTEKLQSFTIKLICKEIIQNTQNKRAADNEKVLYEALLYQSQSARTPSEGEVEFSIPEHTQATQNINNREVVWGVVAQGNVPYWPDMGNEFKLFVI